jgi:hypothetical protein
VLSGETVQPGFRLSLEGEVNFLGFATANGQVTIAISGTKQVGAGASSSISWAGPGVANAVTLLSGTTGNGAGDLPRTLEASATTYDITFGLSIVVPVGAYPSTYTTTLTFRTFTS